METQLNNNQSANITNEIKKLLVMRGLKALAITISMQFVLLSIFLLLVNFHILHPVMWISDTLKLTFSIRTWICITPVLVAVVLYAMCLGRKILTVKKYYPTRFAFVIGEAMHKLTFLGAHLLLALLTSQLYVGFVHVDYQNWTYECFGTKCINSRHIFLICAGMAAGCYHFVKYHFRHELTVQFPIVQQAKIIHIRSLLRETLYESLLESFFPVLVFTFGYCLLASVLHQRCARLFGVEVDEHFNTIFGLAFNFRLIFYAWILASQILSKMQLLQRSFSLLLTEEMHFAITKNPMVTVVNKNITLAEALAITELPIVQNLATFEVYTISRPIAANRRQELFALSTPGNHPHNWQQLASQSLNIINTFTDELVKSVANIASLQITSFSTIMKPSSIEAAEKILLRQYNNTYGIRSMMAAQEPTILIENQTSITAVATSAVKSIQQSYEHCLELFRQSKQTLFRTMPGLFYFFGEVEGSKTLFLLANSQTVVLLIQGLGGICGTSLVEDKYGVVQLMLPQVISSIIKLKTILDKLNKVNGSKSDPNYIALKCAVNRSLYTICSVFGSYLGDLVEKREELDILMEFMALQET